MTAILGTTPAGAPVAVDTEAMIGSHFAIIAQSGFGKSGAIRKLLEQTNGDVLQIILDVEDEFHTLRERYNYVIAGGDGGDAPARVENAADLALAALRHGFNLVAQINDLGNDADLFIGKFLAALMGAPRDLWRPAMIVIDETQRFAPLQGATEATDGIRDLLSRGRKRGFGAVLASLAISEINPRVRGGVNNWLLGHASQTLDRDTMAKQLGFRPSSDEAKGIMHLPKRSFWGFGPALSDAPILFGIGDVETTPVRPGQVKVPVPPAPEALREILAGLVVVGQSGADDAKLVHPETADFRASAAAVEEIAALRGRLVQLEGERDEWTIERAVGQQQLDAMVAENRALHEIAARIGAAASDMARIRPALETLNEVPAQGGGCPEVDEGQTEGRQVMTSAAPRATAPAPAARTATEKAGGGNASSADLPPRRIRILDAIAWGCDHFRRASIDRDIAAWLADTSPRSSSYANDLGALRSAGLVEYPGAGLLALTAAGLDIASPPSVPTTRAALWQAIASKLPPRQVRIVDALFEVSPIDRATLATGTGTTATSSSFANDLGRLRTLGLIDYPSPGSVGLGRVWQ